MGSRRDGYTVIARRYRPQTFADLVGQDSAAQALRGAIAAGRVGHAYLFTGARGVGKTSTARIFAKALNCEHGPTPSPCNECDICRGISTGEDLDVLEIDGASNRGIDEIRELRQNVHVRPSRARFKIYIIDEVHMLTREAFNALLKTLEEPPDHVKFFFCTTEPEKIPITILSRCQRFDFAGIKPGQIVERLRQIAAQEGAEVDDAALSLLARRAAGSMRDSQSLLEQILSFGGKRISAADVHALLGTVGGDRLTKLIAQLGARQPAAALAELDTALAEGCDLGQLLGQLLGSFRDVMVLKVGGTPESLLFSSTQEGADFAQATDALGLEAVLASMQILDQTLARMRYSTHGRILAELALVQLCRLSEIDELPELVAQLREGGVATASPRPAASAVTETSKKNDLNGAGPASAPAAPVAARELPPAAVAELPAPTATVTLTPANAQAIWNQASGSLGGILQGHASICERVVLEGDGQLVVTFRQSLDDSRQYCAQPAHLEQLAAAMQALTGVPVAIRFELVPDPAVAPRAVEPRSARPGVSAQRTLQERSQHPLARRAIELFDAKPLSVDLPDRR
ncbi:MAG: DNA polymerase III subunit gamma/tau [Pirellulales bacterium]|nr:DNA polymerase III subunit gamma/tau [Pirellulales bacterium]